VKTKEPREEVLKKKTFLDKKIRQLFNELLNMNSIRDVLVLSFILSTMLLVLFIFYLSRLHGALFWIYIVLFVLYIFITTVSFKAFNRLRKGTKDEYDIAVKEREAEIEVQDFLRKNLSEEYNLFENIYTGYGDIDAIVVGPTGIYMIEVKSNSGLIAEKDKSKGYLSIIEGDDSKKNYRDQVKKELAQVKNYIDINTGLNSWVYPVLLFPFGSVMKDLNLTSEYDNLILPVLNEKDLLKYIYSNNQTKLASDQIKKIAKALEEWQKG
jgi:Ca2+/Na+ antiporter